VISDNATLNVSGGARLSGESTVTATNNAQATVHDSVVSGRHVAVHTAGNASADVTGSTLQGSLVGPRIQH
jgi:hypothetical protein